MLTLAFFQMYQLALSAINMILQGESTDFNDLGKMMLGGFVLAIGVAVAIRFVRFRHRDKNPPAPFISISATAKKD